MGMMALLQFKINKKKNTKNTYHTLYKNKQNKIIKTGFIFFIKTYC